MEKIINVFISHPTPYNKYQENFLKLIEVELKKHGLNPTNLGKNNWSFKSPLMPIKNIMETCVAAIIIGMERHHSLIGYEKEHSKESKELVNTIRKKTTNDKKKMIESTEDLKNTINLYLKSLLMNLMIFF